MKRAFGFCSRSYYVLELERALDPQRGFYVKQCMSQVITHSDKRADALKGLTEALDKLVIRGPRHNTPFLRALLAHPEVECGDMNTSFIANHFPTGYSHFPHISVFSIKR